MSSVKPFKELASNNKAATPQLDAEIVSQAAHWHTLMQGETISDSDHSKFKAWLAQAPEYALAYQRIDSLWDDIDTVDPQRARDTVKAALNAHKNKTRQRSQSLAASGALLGMLLFFSIFQLAPGNQSLQEAVLSGRLFADYRTGVGEVQEITLSDNSRLRLNTFSSVDIEYTKTQRIIHLRQGELQINVAKDSARPLLVIGSQGSARALGTEFSVRDNENTLEVTVTESQVEVCATDNQQCQIVQAGESTRITDLEVQLPQVVKSGFVIDWARQLLIVDEQPVLDVLDELLRYHKGLVKIDRKALADETVSGVFALTDFAQSLQALEGSIPLQLNHYTAWYTVISKEK